MWNRGCDENEKAARTVSGYGAGSLERNIKRGYYYNVY